MNEKKKILIVNDDEGLREIFRLYLELKGFEIYEAEDGYKGIEQAMQVQPDLILLDVMMPGIDGYEVCRKLKADEKTNQIPIIFLSSLLNSSDKVKGLECGGVDFITNTADQAEILARVETHLKIRALTQEIIANNQELLLKQKALNENLQAAASIQQSLLPTKQSPLPNMKTAWACQPSEFIGGDIFNFIQLDKEHIAFYVLDVSGHGVPSAMVTVSISQYLQQRNQTLNFIPSPKQMLEGLNREYPFEKFNMFSTVFYMLLNPQTGHLIYSSAGHPPPVLLSPHREFKLLDYAGAIIGINPNFPYEEREEDFLPGDKLILYTDGIIEYRNADKELYGSEQFYALLESIKRQPIEEIVKFVMEALRAFGGTDKPPQDDVTILAIEFKKD
jgi:sigma-B regulation protein RsbU (phosphoserine phosphatase)